MRAETDDEGAFAFDEVPAGQWHIIVHAREYQPYQDDFELAADQALELNIVLEPAHGGGFDEFGGVAGVVTDQEGEPIARASVQIMRIPGEGERPVHLAAHTNGVGEFGFERAPIGNYQIAVHAARFNPFEGEFEVVVDEIAELEIELQPVGGGDDVEFGSVSGSVSDAEGEAIAGAIVTMVGPRGGRAVHLNAQTNEEGLFGFDRVPAGEWHFRVQARGFRPFAGDVEVVADQALELEINLEGHNGGGDDDEIEFGAIHGLATNVDGEAIPGVRILIEGEIEIDGNIRPVRLAAQTNREGMFGMRRVPAGEYHLTAGRIGFEPFEDDVEVVAEEVLEIEFSLEAIEEGEIEFGSVSGSVVDVAGEPIELAHIHIRPANRNDWQHPRRHRPQVVFTNEEGLFAFEQVPAGNYIARAAKRGYASAVQEFEVVVDENTELEFALEARGGGDHRGGRERHGREMVELHGIAIVVEGDRGNAYLLDVDNDEAADYLLNFGPADYEPENGAQRPEAGDEIDIAGVQVGHMDPPMVIVTEINGEVWRELRIGGEQFGFGIAWDNFLPEGELVEAEGFNMINGFDWHDRSLIDIDEDGEADYRLIFGDETYDPENGMDLPAMGEFANIIGAEYEAKDGVPIIVVYQIDGVFWREPGNTEGLYWDGAQEVEDSDDNYVPVKSALISAYPNPFNPEATISVSLPESGDVRVSLFDMRGREVIALHRGYMTAGNHSFLLNGRSMMAGTYIVRMVSPAGAVTQKLVLLK